MALGVTMVVVVLSIHGVVAESFRSNASLGYNVIVGAKGGKMQLTLNTVFYLSQPVENLPYEFYLEFCSAAKREEEWKNSLRYRQPETGHEATKTGDAAVAPATPADGHRHGSPQSAGDVEVSQATPLATRREGKYAKFTALAIPLCLGDFFEQFRVVGTTPDFFDKLTYGPDGASKYEFAQGRNFRETAFFEAVLGSHVARDTRLKVGDTVSPTHGDPEGSPHASKFEVVGVLKPTGTPNDRAVFVNMEGFYLMADHAKPLDAEAEAEEAGHPAKAGGPDAPHEHEHEHDHAEGERLPLEHREVTAILVRTISPLVTPGLQKDINKGLVGQAVLPVREIFSLLDLIVRPIQLALLLMTVLICIVSGVSILVSIYNSMSDRRHEIAVMRALGASRLTVMSVILLESILLSLGGGVVGWLGGHLLNALASSRIESQTGVAMGFWDLAPPIRNLELWGMGPVMGLVSAEVLIIPLLIALAVVVGFLPAVAAYRTPVSESL
jgi:putative ABC transport system permease protein